MYRMFFKRFLDVLIASIVFILFLPIFFCITILLFISNNGKPFFFQERPGYQEKIFRIIKFKSMNDRKDTNGKLLPDEFRLTKVGNFVRRTSIDELPQLLNVIKGDMSLIGPRPLRTYYLPLYSDIQKRRHNVKPGITGWAQVNGRNAISWTSKFNLDVYYVENISFILDLKILFLTIKKVLIREGVSKAGHVTTLPFDGNN